MLDVEQVYKDKRDIVFGRVCNTLGENSQACEDIVSEVFLDLTRFAKTGRLKEESSIDSALFTITDRRIADYWRRKYSDRGHFLKMALEEASKIKSPEEQIIYDFELRGLFTKVWDSLEKLSDKERDVFVRHCLLGEDTVTIVNLSGISESVVKKLYTSAKKKLAVAIRSTVRGDAQELPNKERLEWLDKFYGAYLHFGEKSGHLTDGIKLAAARAYSAMRQDLEKK